METQILVLPDSRRTWILYAILIGSLAWLCFGDLRHHLLDTHDAQSFQDHLRIDQDGAFFFSPDKAQASGRPLAEAVKYAIYRVCGNDPAAFHLSVVALHALASLLLAGTCRRMGADLELSLLGGLLFLVNVTHFQAVHHISALDYPLALICSLLSLRAYLDYLDGGSRRSWILFALFLVLGLMAHLSVVAVVPFVLFYSYRQGTAVRALVYQLLALGVLLVCALSLLLSITSHETSTWWSIDRYAGPSLFSLVVGMGRMLLWFVSRLLTTAHWLPLPIYRLQTWELYLGGLLLVGLLAAIWKKTEPVWVWAVWVLLWLVPFLLLTEATILDLPAGPSRYLYPASAGSSLLLAWVLRQGIGRLRRGRRALLCLVLLLLLFSSYRSLAQVEAISLYTSGRCYIANNELETGIDRLKTAIARGAGTIDLKDAYDRLCRVLIFTDGDELEAYLKMGREAFPDDPTLRIYQLTAESMQADSASAESAWRQLRSMRQHPDAADLIARSYFNWGKQFGNRGAQQRAIQAYERSLEFVPDRTNTLRELGLSRLKTGDVEAAQTAYRRACELDPRDHLAMYGLALVLERSGEPEEAITLCRRGLRIRPWLPTFRLLGECLQKSGRHAEALEVYRQALVHYPTDGVLHLQQTRALQATGDRRESGADTLEKAVQAYGEAIRRMPDDPNLYHGLGMAQIALGRRSAARRSFQQAVALKSARIESHLFLVSLLKEENRPAEALAACEGAIREFAGNGNAASGAGLRQLFVELSQLRHQAGDAAGAIEALEEAIALEGDHAGDHFTLGSLYYITGQYDRAVGSLRRAVQLDPQQPQFHSYLGTALRQLGQLPAAEQAYQEAARLEPGEPRYHQNLGVVQLQQQKDRQALASLQRAIRTGSRDLQVHLTVADLCLRLDQPEEARRIYRQLLDGAAADLDAETRARIEAFLDSGDSATSR